MSSGRLAVSASPTASTSGISSGPHEHQEALEGSDEPLPFPEFLRRVVKLVIDEVRRGVH